MVGKRRESRLKRRKANKSLRRNRLIPVVEGWVISHTLGDLER